MAVKKVDCLVVKKGYYLAVLKVVLKVAMMVEMKVPLRDVK